MGDLSRSHNNKHHLWSKKMGLKLVALLLTLSLLFLSQANPVEDDSRQHLANSAANQIGANLVAPNQAGHDLTKREAGRGRKASCEGKRCSKKRTPKKAKKGKKANQKPKNNEKKRKTLKRNRLQRRKKMDETKKKAKSGKKSKKRKGGKKKTKQ